MKDFDEVLQFSFYEDNIDYGIIRGSNTIYFIKAGQNGSIYGYQYKYLEMANLIHTNSGASVICSSNPFPLYGQE